MTKNKYFILAVLAVVFIAVRLPIAITAADQTWHLYELHVGTIAKELIEGPSLPLFDYQLSHTRGGTLLAGFFAVPFFLLFGQSLFALKLAALLVSLIILAATYLFLWRFFGKRIAVIAGALMAVSLPIYTVFSLTLHGRNYESILFTVITMSLFYRIFFTEAPTPGASGRSQNGLYCALFGLAGGLGMYFDYIFSITLILCFVFWFIFDKIFFARREFRLFLACFAVGLTPWIYYNLTHHFAAVCVDDNYPSVPLRALFFLTSPAEAGGKLRDLLVYHLPGFFYFRDVYSVSGDPAAYAYYGIFLLSLGVLLWLNRTALRELACGIIPGTGRHLVPGPRYRAAFILLYPVAFSLLYSFSYYLISKKSEYNFLGFYEYTFLIVLCPFIFIIIAMFLEKLWERGRGGSRSAAILFGGIFFFLMASGLSADYGLARLRNFGDHSVADGYNYDILGIVIGERYGRSVPEAARIASGIREPYRASVFRGIGFNIGWRLFRGREYATRDACLGVIDGIDPRYRPFVLEGFGAFLELQLRGIIYAAAYADAMGEQYRPYVYRGIGWFMGMRFKDRFPRAIEQIERIDEAYRPECYRGLGEMAGMIFGRNTRRSAAALKDIDPRYRPYALEGSGHTGK